MSISNNSLKKNIDSSEIEEDSQPDLTPAEEFAWTFYNEHLEEISFLFEQRQSIFTDSEITWLDIEVFENRLIAHIDAMETGGESAGNCARLYLTEEAEEPCDIFAAVYSLTLPSIKDISQLFDKMLEAETEHLQAYFQAFRFSKHPDLPVNLTRLLNSDRAEMVTGALRVLSERRWIKPEQILPYLKDQYIDVIIAAIEVLGESNSKTAIKEIEPFTTHDNIQVKKVALLTLLRLGHIKSLNTIIQSCHNSSADIPWLSLYLALAGQGKDYSILLPGKSGESIQQNSLQALGILGHIEAIEILLHTLKNNDKTLHLPAARALQLITGAELTETVTITEDIDPDELFEDEKPPEPETKEVEQICISYDEWNKWCQKNSTHFKSTIRYRHGKPFTPDLCIEEIASERSSFEDRKRAYLELVIRTGIDIPFKPDWLVSKQKKAIKQLQTWWQQNQKRYTPGSWTFHGKVI